MKLPDKLVIKFTKNLIISRCEPDWGGTFAYASNEAGNCRVCGFKTVMSARRHAASFIVADNDMGSALIKEFVRLYNRHERLKQKTTNGRKLKTKHKQ